MVERKIVWTEKVIKEIGVISGDFSPLEAVRNDNSHKELAEGESQLLSTQYRTVVKTPSHL